MRACLSICCADILYLCWNCLLLFYEQRVLIIIYYILNLSFCINLRFDRFLKIYVWNFSTSFPKKCLIIQRIIKRTRNCSRARNLHYKMNNNTSSFLYPLFMRRTWFKKWKIYYSTILNCLVNQIRWKIRYALKYIWIETNNAIYKLRSY